MTLIRLRERAVWSESSLSSLSPPTPAHIDTHMFEGTLSYAVARVKSINVFTNRSELFRKADETSEKVPGISLLPVYTLYIRIYMPVKTV